MSRVRDAMIPEPQTLDGSASAQEAGQHLTQPDVRAVYVCDGGRFVGVVTRKTLVSEVVAAGRDPRETRVGEIAEPPNWTIDPELPLDEAFSPVTWSSRAARTRMSHGSSSSSSFVTRSQRS